MDVAKMTVGEIYNWRGRRARLDKIEKDPASGRYHVVVSTGRDFATQSVIGSHTWMPSEIALQETWDEYKTRKAREREQAARDEQFGERVDELLEQLGVSGHYWNGTLSIYGDQQELLGLVEKLEQLAEGPKNSALSALLD